MRARIQLEPGYVLSAKPYTESSLLLEVFTRNHGRAGLVARGARGPKSKTRALLQVLQPLLLSWTESGELGTLTAAEAGGVMPPLPGERVFYGWYLNELLLRLLHRRDPHPQLYDAYATTLAQLADTQAETALRLFERDLLTEIGYGLHLPDAPDPTLHYRYDGDAEPRPAPPGPASVSGASLIALEQGLLETPQALADARKILRAALARQLGGRELETPKLMRQMRNLETGKRKEESGK